METQNPSYKISSGTINPLLKVERSIHTSHIINSVLYKKENNSLAVLTAFFFVFIAFRISRTTDRK